MTIVDKRILNVIKRIDEERWPESDLPAFSVMLEAVVLADYAARGSRKLSGSIRAELEMARPGRKQYSSKVRYALNECTVGMANNIAHLLEMRRDFQKQQWECFVRTYFALYCNDIKIVESLLLQQTGS